MESSELKSSPGRKFSSRFLLHLHIWRSHDLSSVMNTLSDRIHTFFVYQLSSYAEANQLKPLIDHTRGCLRASLRDWLKALFTNRTHGLPLRPLLHYRECSESSLSRVFLSSLFARKTTEQNRAFSAVGSLLWNWSSLAKRLFARVF